MAKTSNDPLDDVELFTPAEKWRRRLILLGALVVAVGAIALASRQSTAGSGASRGGSIVQTLRPVDGASSVSATDVFGIDLESGWVGSLVVENNGRTFVIPDDETTMAQLGIDDESTLREIRQRIPIGNINQGQIFFRPGPGLAIEELGPGETCVTARYWPIADGPNGARITSWCFSVF
ncbi:MAG: hypothetical protein GY698_22085 [Actinomycetia bacterium]|nr:hypothetical protein [Actinomycetes bacterium]